MRLGILEEMIRPPKGHTVSGRAQVQGQRSAGHLQSCISFVFVCLVFLTKFVRNPHGVCLSRAPCRQGHLRIPTLSQLLFDKSCRSVPRVSLGLWGITSFRLCNTRNPSSSLTDAETGSEKPSHLSKAPMLFLTCLSPPSALNT